jgi:hypothetical protein
VHAFEPQPMTRRVPSAAKAGHCIDEKISLRKSTLLPSRGELTWRFVSRSHRSVVPCQEAVIAK